MEPRAYFLAARNLFREHSQPAVAEGQIAYMKNHFDFFGLKAPVWLGLSRRFFAENGLPEGADLLQTVRLCFDDEHREMHYFGLELLQKQLKKLPADEGIFFLEELILEKSWWDSVDWLAKLTGLHFKKHPNLIAPTVERWMASEKMWLQRVCLIFQLTYRANTDLNLLFSCIDRLASSREFFIQKAMGWALRQHSRADAQAVRAFVESRKLPALTRREALRLIGG